MVPNYFNKPVHRPIYTTTNTKAFGKLLKEAEKNEEVKMYNQSDENVVPGVFPTGSDIDSVIRDFGLNAKQSFAFRIICNHALGHHLPSEPNLLMGVFGEGGTGKSRLIDAIRVWFQ